MLRGGGGGGEGKVGRGKLGGGGSATLIFGSFSTAANNATKEAELCGEGYPTNANKQFLLCSLVPLHVSAFRCHLQGVTVSLFISYSRLSIKYSNSYD
jgi:hypothetical protein